LIAVANNFWLNIWSQNVIKYLFGSEKLIIAQKSGSLIEPGNYLKIRYSDKRRSFISELIES